MPPLFRSTRPGATPGTPPRRRPRPPSGFSRKYAPACAARRPAISLIGASRGSRPSAVSTVSYATAVTPLSASARVKGSSAATCRYVKSTSPSRSWGYSCAMGSFTLSKSSDSLQTSSVDTTCAPTRSYAASGKALPTPAPVSMETSWPRLVSSRAPAGVSATRYSSVLISFATPIFTAGEPYTGALTGTVSAQPRHTGADTIAVGGGFGVPHGARSSDLAAAQVEQQPRQGLAVFDLAEPRGDLGDGNTHELDRLVVFQVPLARHDAFGEEQVHQPAAEAGRRPER